MYTTVANMTYLYSTNTIPMSQIQIVPIATIHNDRTEIQDDHWGEVISEIQLISHMPPSSLIGIEAFSHIHVIYYFHLVDASKIKLDTRHPRNLVHLPLVGILAQRAKNRPNCIGIAVCELIAVNDDTLLVKGLDAIDGTPVIDIKPYMEEFDVRASTQPDWTREIMRHYY
jgi:tRNA (adenine37-N6)-methyltransferase